MKIFLIIFLSIVALILIILIAAFWMKRTHYVNREIVINSPVDSVYNYLRMLKNQDKFNKWAKDAPDRNWQYKGTDGTVGFVISWNGNKDVGQGEKEIMGLIENEKIITQIRFVRPMVTTADIVFETHKISANQTKLNMINSGTISYPMNIFIPLAEKNFPKDMDSSLMKLKTILENK